ncbi:plasmid pRiA4b ORF-3 family protein [Mongoliibacter ruber]|uniref:PRiA4b ORF-3-like protein n=1 Tax=Mongoliibacter ruber TaxID=1750599 RepID=A0A2T0WH14_9BACT|nr:plasmid pRiA4b ORF-3 family protein [Mongoliibacter ruber]PRY85945.1 pRiA4b ORF-3-like protein [Mongoliibacter ruber]
MTKIIPLIPEPIKLKITLENMPFSIYRKVLVPSSINMLQLHQVIQVAMGWENCHLFQFNDKKFNASISVEHGAEDNDMFGGFSSESFEAEELSLEEFLTHTDGKSFWYWYDFGDDWWHKISIQKVTKKDMANYKANPLCTEAMGACPPEDIGGPWGFAEFTEVINNKKNPQSKEMREWLGMKARDKWDFDAVDIEEINEDLDYIWNEWPLEEGED